MMTKPLYELPSFTYFKFNSYILRREDATQHGPYFNVRTRSGELQILRGYEHVAPIEFLTVGDLVKGEVFTFDLWDLRHSGICPKVSTHVWNLLLQKEVTFLGAEGEKYFLRFANGSDIYVEAPHSLRVYTRGHSPPTLQSAEVGSVFTHAHADSVFYDVYTVKRILSQYVDARDAQGRAYAVPRCTSVRIWNNDEGYPSIANALSTAPGLPMVTRVEDVPDLKYFEYAGVVYRKNSNREPKYFGDVPLNHPTVFATRPSGHMATLEFGTQVSVIEELRVRHLVAGEKFTLDPSVLSDPHFKSLDGYTLLGELTSSLPTEDQDGSLSMVVLGADRGGHTGHFIIPVFDSLRAYTKGYPRPGAQEIGAAEASKPEFVKPEPVIAPSCRRCKQPFGPYRKQVNAVCGDCVAAGTSLADQPPPAAAPEKKSRHWEAWSTPSYDGEG